MAFNMKNNNNYLEKEIRFRKFQAGAVDSKQLTSEGPLIFHFRYLKFFDLIVG